MTVVTFDEEAGTAGALYADEVQPLLRLLGPGVTARASDVEPVRTWPEGNEGWVARIRVDGHVLGPFTTRAEALDAERAYLLEVL